MIHADENTPECCIRR